MMDVVVVSGFLGSGKTTLITHILGSNTKDLGRVALIVNEFGDIGVDGSLLSGQNVDMLEISSGCICCSLRGDFSRAIQEIRDRIAPDSLIVEATGVAQPADILDVLYADPARTYCRMAALVTVVDADFFQARETLGPFYRNQISCADKLILNKVDLVSPGALQDIRAILREMNPVAPIYTARYCAVDLGQILPGDPHHRENRHGVHDCRVADGFQTFSFTKNGIMDRAKLETLLANLPLNLFRLKGWVQFSGSCDLVNFAAGRYSIAPWDEPRETALTMIGYNCNADEILSALKECFTVDQPVNDLS